MGVSTGGDEDELPDASHFGNRDPPSPASSAALQARDLLDSLLQPLTASSRSIAARLISEFGSLQGVFAAPAAHLRCLLPTHPDVADHIGRLRATMLHMLKEEAFTGPVVSNKQALLDYLMIALGHAREEQIRVLYLNAANSLVRDEVFEGGVNEAPVRPRIILRRALEVGATALILVHNHPSGDPEPSRADIRATSNLRCAARVFEIELHDHLIIGRGQWTSFRDRGLL